MPQGMSNGSAYWLGGGEDLIAAPLDGRYSRLRLNESHLRL